MQGRLRGISRCEGCGAGAKGGTVKGRGSEGGGGGICKERERGD